MSYLRKPHKRTDTVSNQKARQLLKTSKVLSKGHRYQPEEALTSQNQDIMSVYTENDHLNTNEFKSMSSQDKAFYSNHAALLASISWDFVISQTDCSRIWYHICSLISYTDSCTYLLITHFLNMNLRSPKSSL